MKREQPKSVHSVRRDIHGRYLIFTTWYSGATKTALYLNADGSNVGSGLIILQLTDKLVGEIIAWDNMPEELQEAAWFKVVNAED